MRPQLMQLWQEGIRRQVCVVDISSAFAEVERCLVVNDCASAERLKEALARYGVATALVDDMVAEIASTTFWAETGASAHLEAQLTACLANTFATFEGIAGGTRMAREQQQGILSRTSCS